jgi:hypothetical protein
VRAAPPVSVRCSGGLPWRALRVALPALAAAAVAGLALGHAGLPTAWALVVVLALVPVGWARTPTTAISLAWDGQRWTADGEAGVLDVMVDAGAGMLLRLRPGERRRPQRWIAVTAAEAGPAMHGLRAAAYAAAAGVAPGVGAATDGGRLPH